MKYNFKEYYNGGFRIHRNLIINRETKRTVLRALDGVSVQSIKKVITALESDGKVLTDECFSFYGDYIYENNEKAFFVEGLQYLNLNCGKEKAERIVSDFKDHLCDIFND